MPITLQIEGMKELMAKIQTLPNETKQILDDELTASAFEMVDNAKRLAPVDLGNLINRIVVSRNNPLEKWVSAEANYSAYVEFGTGTAVSMWPVPKDLEGYALQFKGMGKQGKHPVKFKDGSWRMVPYQLNLRAHPYFFPAYQLATQDLVKNLKKLIEEEGKK